MIRRILVRVNLSKNHYLHVLLVFLQAPMKLPTGEDFKIWVILAVEVKP